MNYQLFSSTMESNKPKREGKEAAARVIAAELYSQRDIKRNAKNISGQTRVQE